MFNLPALYGKSNEAGYFDHRVCVIVKDVEHHNHVLEHIEENSPETDGVLKGCQTVTTNLTESPSVVLRSFQNWMSFLNARNSNTLCTMEITKVQTRR